MNNKFLHAGVTNNINKAPTLINIFFNGDKKSIFNQRNQKILELIGQEYKNYANKENLFFRDIGEHISLLSARIIDPKLNSKIQKRKVENKNKPKPFPSPKPEGAKKKKKISPYIDPYSM